MHTFQSLLAFFQDTDSSSATTAAAAAEANIQHIILGMIPFLILFGLACCAFMIFLYWRIFSKTGMSPWLSLLLLVPFGSLIMQCILAFGDWPALQPPPPPPPAA